MSERQLTVGGMSDEATGEADAPKAGRLERLQKLAIALGASLAIVAIVSVVGILALGAVALGLKYAESVFENWDCKVRLQAALDETLAKADPTVEKCTVENAFARCFVRSLDKEGVYKTWPFECIYDGKKHETIPNCELSEWRENIRSTRTKP